MKRETAESIIEFIGDFYSNLYGDCRDQGDITDHEDEFLIDGVLKIAKSGASS